MRRASLIQSVLAPAACAVGLLVFVEAAGAVAIVYNDGGVHIVNTNIAPDSIEVRTATTVNLEAGANVGATGGSSVSTFDNAIYNQSGGVLTDELFMFNSSMATITGGQIVDDITTNDNAVATVHNVTVDDDLEIRGNSTMHVFGGNFNEDVESFDTATGNIHGGLFQTGTDGANVEAGGSSVINIFGGSFGTGETDGAGHIGAIDTAAVNIYGGNISGMPEGLETSGGGKINVFGFSGGQPAAINTAAGGMISFFDGPLSNLVANDPGVRLLGTDGSLASIIAEDSSVITIHGSNFKWSGVVNLPYGPLTFSSGNLSGMLSDGATFNVPFQRRLAAGGVIGQIILAPPVPEPASFALSFIALVGLAFIHQRSRQA
jgi:hypothetical protein